MSDSKLQELIDRAEISDVVHAYATALDWRDWALYRRIFCDRVEMDFASIGVRAGSYRAEDWVRDAQRLFAGFAATQHTSTNHVHDLQGDEATCVSNMQAEHFLARAEGDGLAEGAERWTIGGTYTNRLVRSPEGWKISGLTLTVTWTWGNREVPRIAIERSRAARKRTKG